MTLSFMLFVSVLFAGVLMQSPADEDVKIRDVVERFSKAADIQDVSLMRQTLHPEAQQFFVGPEGLVRLPTGAYLDMLEQKKIGGIERKLKIADIDVNGNLASVKASMKNDAVHFENFFSLMNVDDEWVIVSVILRMEMQ